MRPAVIFALLATATADETWSVLKNFDLSSMDAVRADWKIEQWTPGFVNDELEAYVDSPNNLYTDANGLVLKAVRNTFTCAYYANADIKGHDWYSVPATLKQECCFRCRQAAQCKAFAFASGRCYLKTSYDNMVTSGTATVGICADVTSSRLVSKAFFSPVNVPGRKIRIEFTAKVPTVKGAWPALWVLGKDGPYGHWPEEGEIDVMEWVWQLQTKVQSSLHWKGPMDWGTGFDLSWAQLGQWTTYGVELSSVPGDEYVQYYVITADGHKTLGKNAPASTWASSFNSGGPNKCLNRVPGGKLCTPLAPFDNQNNLILNFAVGGNWGGCCGVNGDYSAFDGSGVTFPIKSVVVSQLQAPPTPPPPPPNPTGAPEKWQLLKAFDFSSMAKVHSEWVVEKWAAGAFNNEMEAYVDDPATLFLDASGFLNLKAIKSKTCDANLANTDIGSDNIADVSGQPVTACCGLCFANAACQSWSWNDFQGGTCWLKATTGPTVSKSGVTANVMCSVKSARVHSQFSFSPARDSPGRKIRVEATAQVPTVPGAWPAIWLLGASAQYGNWPQEGEIDLMEWVWSIQDQIYSSLHWKSGDDWHTSFGLDMGTVAASFVTYGVEYSAVAGDEYVQYFVTLPSGVTSWGPRAAASMWQGSWKPTPACPQIVPGGSKCTPLAPFDNPMMVILNVAVGGDWGGIDVGDYSAFTTGVAMRVKSITVFHN